MELNPYAKHLMELGGKGNVLVLDDANLELAAKEIIQGAFKFSGQRCDAITRVLVTKKNYKKLLKLLKKYSKIPFASKDKNGIVPLIDKKAIEKAIKSV